VLVILACPLSSTWAAHILDDKPALFYREAGFTLKFELTAMQNAPRQRKIWRRVKNTRRKANSLAKCPEQA